MERLLAFHAAVLVVLVNFEDALVWRRKTVRWLASLICSSVVHVCAVGPIAIIAHDMVKIACRQLLCSLRRGVASITRCRTRRCPSGPLLWRASHLRRDIRMVNVAVSIISISRTALAIRASRMCVVAIMFAVSGVTRGVMLLCMACVAIFIVTCSRRWTHLVLDRGTRLQLAVTRHAVLGAIRWM